MYQIRRVFAGALSFVVMAMGGLALVTAASESVAQTPPAVFPLGLMCWTGENQRWAFAYIGMIEKDGTAEYYVPPGGQFVARVTATGVVKAPETRPAVSDCYGKTIAELRAMGRTIERQVTR